MNKVMPPKGLRKGGQVLWLKVTEHLDLDHQEEAILLEAARTVDRLDALDRQIRRRGTVLPDGRPSPLLAEARQQQITFARLIASLRLPEDLTEPDKRPQRRGAIRGIYTNFRHRRGA